jgi:hypothetical protein
MQFKYKDINRLKVKGREKTYYANTVWQLYMTAHKIDFRSKNIFRNKEDSFVMTKGLINQKDLMILNTIHLIAELQNTRSKNC